MQAMLLGFLRNQNKTPLFCNLRPFKHEDEPRNVRSAVLPGEPQIVCVSLHLVAGASHFNHPNTCVAVLHTPPTLPVWYSVSLRDKTRAKDVTRKY